MKITDTVINAFVVIAILAIAYLGIVAIIVNL
jgi:hypothetical protein